MEFIGSDTNGTDSDELDEDLENELYSVLHYNVLSEDIPSNILDKYDIKRTEQNEFLISLKKAKQESFKEIKGTSEDIKDTTEETIASEEDAESVLDPSGNFITISDDDSDSDVILNEPPLEVTYVSSPSVVEVPDSSSGSDMESNVILNIGDRTTLSSTFPIDDFEEEVIKFKWKEVTSPSSWTNDMKKYYNKPCERLKNFDYEKIREEIKGNGEWNINLADRLPSNRRIQRCTICRETDHKKKNCPRKFVNCHMCGNTGHNEYHCPSKKCLNCGRKNAVYVAMCKACEAAKFKTCSECQQEGHTKDLCPDTWRRYHATTKGELVVKEETVNERLMCCNCAQSGHLFENCPKLYWSPYPPTSCLIKKTEEPLYKSPKGKRFRGTEEDAADFVRTPKKRRLNHNNSDKSSNGPNWNRGSFNRTQNQYRNRTPNSFGRNRTQFGRNPVPFNQNDSPFVRNPIPFDRTSTPFNERSIPFNQRSNPFHQRPTPFDQGSTPFNQRSTSFNQRPTPFNQRSTPFNEASTPFNQRSTPFNKASTPFNQRSTPFNKASTPFNQRSTPFNNASTPFNQRLISLNEASTSTKHSKPLMPKRNNKVRYFHNNALNSNVNTIKQTHNQIKSPKQRKKKKKKNNSFPNKTI
ncbi:zinc finger CCHC domain-containing protein 7 [Halyomorpha halys]|uniref:zinc finger CCHC domain-containing protein 7 n=1 Tax=Halyomorpha halys TaxID=286706 RepID=UPI0006D52400|nr:zinc finger CCHC domain-containing protein 7-like [Halyomorpha halys]